VKYYRQLEGAHKTQLQHQQTFTHYKKARDTHTVTCKSGPAL